MSNYLVLSKLNIRNASAISSPVTVGVPALTTFLGTAHKLQRGLNERGYSGIRITGAGVILHEAEMKGFKDYKNGFHFTSARNPMTKEAGGLKFPASIPDTKIDMNLSLVCEVEDPEYEIDNLDEFYEAVSFILSYEVKLAGGEIREPKKDGRTVSFREGGSIRYLKGVSSGNEEDLKKIKRLVTPGYALIERRSLLKKDMEDGKDCMEALFDYLSVYHTCTAAGKGGEWAKEKKAEGWLVPIAVGYQGLMMPKYVENQREGSFPTVFAESIITLGEYRAIGAIKDIDSIIWRYSVDLANNTYSCVNEHITGENNG